MPTDTKKLKGKIIENGYTIKSFAEKLKLSAATLSQKINNKIKFSQSDIKAISELLDLTPTEIKDIFLN